MRLPDTLRRHWPLAGLGGLLLLALLWATLAPLGGGSHELLLEAPPGAHRAGLQVPAEIRLTRGVRDVLLLRNRDSAPLVFGPVDVAPWREFRLTFEEEGEHAYACPLVAGGVVRVRVLAWPDPGLDRLRWRLDNLVQALRWLPLRGPDS
ncbi:hypothetical protein [Massilia sp. ST3]|uniref:cupredoxin domain-containing protein n=1 Tax=Massilia sp. ST3 TaxID=2824903 RepID=UPI001B80EB1A|nr:hypothetical protein [Massilia sp. ST3]MBQ5949381.1 hypothetical protein [Massilia sp. ST3]